MRAGLLYSILIGSLSSMAWGYSDFVPLRERAQGHSLTGAIQTNDSVYSNPAGSTFGTTYSVDGTFAFPKSFSTSIVDTRTSSVGGGIGYFREQNPASSLSMQGLRLSLGSKVTENLGLAVAGKAIWGGTNPNSSFKDVDAGALWNLGTLTAGVVLRNFFGGREEFSQKRELSVGARMGYSDTVYFSASAHSQLDRFAPYEYGFGAEYISPWYFSLMGGYRFQRQPSGKNPSYWSTGLSFLSPRLSVHYAVEFPQQPNEESSHLLGATMLF